MPTLGRLTAQRCRKEPIDLSIMDFKQMFDSEEVSTCLNALYDAQIQDDMLSLIYEANKTTYFAVKTPNGVTEKTRVQNKILQGDVLAPCSQVTWLINILDYLQLCLTMCIFIKRKL